MNAPDPRWRLVDALYHKVASRPVHERRASLAAACTEDSELAAEVQSLLDQPESATEFLSTPAADVVARLVSAKDSLLSGSRIGVFEVTDLLGVGGMGEVYRARDTKLGRDVAVKVLPEEFAHDHARLARFNREAQALASLNHPNIAVIYAVEEIPAVGGSGPGSRALVMELIEGEDLSTRIARGPLPVSEALLIAQQIAKALEAAHEHGIVHRDLKPANIKIRADRTIKILDFGLAQVPPSPTAGDREGAIQPRTEAGAVMGTPGYMSPEQIRGQRVDWRSDLFTFGVVLYEMLSGQRAFEKDSGVETLSATLTETPPDLKTVAPGTDPALALTVAHCIEKLPQNRFQSAKDLGFALEMVGTTSGRQSSLRPARASGRPIAGAVVVLAVGLALMATQETGIPGTLPAGANEVALESAPVFPKQRAAVQLEAGAAATVKSPIIGKISVGAIPDNCKIFVDGTVVDYLPILDRALVAGSHVVAFEWPDGARTEEKVVIVAGKSSKVIGRKP
ncbi:MAG: serine/threonine protein kinase [Vicinamibacteria bacterium]|nr:serine/threonine protein kinase [Vicinamibacteria bacterium]